MPFALPRTIPGALRGLKSSLGFGTTTTTTTNTTTASAAKPAEAAAATVAMADDTAGSAAPTAQAAARLGSDAFFELLRVRHSYYALGKDLGAAGGAERVRSIVEQAVVLTPSSFNSQPGRAVVLFGEDHDRFWDITRDALKAIVPDDKWEGTGKKMDNFKGSAGTILFFEDQDVVQAYERNVPSYADKFGLWAAQSDAMLQFAVWVALESEGLGANLQHYNPLVDEAVRETWKVPPSWRLNAQLVFGSKGPGVNPLKEQQPLEKRVRVFGA